MDLGRRGTTRSGVVAGSVWESRMKIDEVKGGIKVFNGEENSEENGDSTTVPQLDRKLKPKQSVKRKTWKSESPEGFEKNPIQIARKRSEAKKNLDEQIKELSVSADSIKKSPNQMKTRSEMGKELRTSIDGIERSPIQKKKTRSEEFKELSVSVDGIQRNPIQSRKSKSELLKEVGQTDAGNERNSIQLRKLKSESNEALIESTERNSIPLTREKSMPSKILDESGKNQDGLTHGVESNSDSVEGIEKNLDGIKKIGSDESCKEFDVCEEKVISSSLSNVGQPKSAPEMVVIENVDDDDDDEEDEDWEELEEEVEKEIEVEIEKKSVDIKEINISESKPKQIVNEVKKIHQIQEKPVPISPIVKRQPPSPVIKKSRNLPNPTKSVQIPVPNEFRRVPETHNKLQSLVDLVMWRDISKSALVFGFGTFLIISSSYTEEINLSCITVVSYFSLVYLALIFLFRSIIFRGAIDIDDTDHGYVVGEEEAVWVLKLVLPYLNEFLLKIRALFSGDPATTMKLAVLLFVLARCGSYITIWKMAKLGFFGIFTIPKVCSSYSTQLTAYGKFWIRRFRDAWESCSHKKAVAFAIFTLVWNLSSIVARIWAVFMLFVAFRYYQQSLMRDDWVEEEAGGQDTWQGPVGGHRQGRGPTIAGIKKSKKAS